MSQEVPFKYLQHIESIIPSSRKRRCLEGVFPLTSLFISGPQLLYKYQGTEIKKYQLVPLDTVLSILKSHIQDLFPSRTKVGTELEHSPKTQ
tara:strand:- start:369 stop:644 length:276 start_codon:yes stop_codon:yes gene_type:complete